jgi:hypothetical protein
MTQFITLNSTQAKAVARYKQEVRAIVVDRAADHIEQRLPSGRKPTERQYDKAFAEGLQKAKLEVMAELFRLMHDLARDNTVAEWSRREDGLRRKPRSDAATLKLIGAYEQIVRYVSGIRAHPRAAAKTLQPAQQKAAAKAPPATPKAKPASATRRK